MRQILFVPHTEEEYERLVSFLDDLIDEVGEDKTHPLASLIDIDKIVCYHPVTKYFSAS